MGYRGPLLEGVQKPDAPKSGTGNITFKVGSLVKDLGSGALKLHKVQRAKDC